MKGLQVVIETKYANISLTIDFEEAIEHINTAKNRIKKVKKLLKLIDNEYKDTPHEDIPDYVKRHRNWLALNTNNLNCWKLKQQLYYCILEKSNLKKKLPTLKTKFINILNVALEIFEEGLKIEAINEGEYLTNVNNIKEAYNYHTHIIEFLLDAKDIYY